MGLRPRLIGLRQRPRRRPSRCGSRQIGSPRPKSGDRIRRARSNSPIQGGAPQLSIPSIAFLMRNVEKSTPASSGLERQWTYPDQTADRGDGRLSLGLPPKAGGRPLRARRERPSLLQKLRPRSSIDLMTKRHYFLAVQTERGWCVQGGAFTKVHAHAEMNSAVAEARAHASYLHGISGRPTGVRVKYEDGSVIDDQLYGTCHPDG